MNNTDNTDNEAIVLEYIQSEIRIRARQLSNPDSAFWKKVGHRPSPSCLKTASEYESKIADTMNTLHPAAFFYGPMPKDAEENHLLGLIWKITMKLNIIHKVIAREILKAEAEAATRAANAVLADSKMDAILNNQNMSEEAILR